MERPPFGRLSQCLAIAASTSKPAARAGGQPCAPPPHLLEDTREVRGNPFERRLLLRRSDGVSANAVEMPLIIVQLPPKTPPRHYIKLLHQAAT